MIDVAGSLISMELGFLIIIRLYVAMDSGKSIKSVLQVHHRSTSSRNIRLATMTKCTFTITARQARGTSCRIFLAVQRLEDRSTSSRSVKSTINYPSTSSGNVGRTLFFNNHHCSTSSRSVVSYFSCSAKIGWPLDKLADRQVDFLLPFDKLRERRTYIVF